MEDVRKIDREDNVLMKFGHQWMCIAFARVRTNGGNLCMYRWTLTLSNEMAKIRCSLWFWC